MSQARALGRCGAALALVWLAATTAACAQVIRPEPATASVMASQDMPIGDRWVLVLNDPRSDRRRLGRDSLGYGNRGEYDSDPLLQRLASDVGRDYQLAVVEQWPINSLKVHCVVIDVSGSSDRAATHAALLADPRVQAVQAVHEFKTFQRSAADETITAQATTADPLRYLQTALDLLQLDALPARLDGSGVTVAVIDSAADLSHGDLSSAQVEQRDVAQARHPLPMQGEAHGTAMAGVIAARPRNGIGIRGIAPGVQLKLLRACWQPAADQPALCDSLTLSRALDRCIALAPHILNLSLSGPPDPLLERLLSQLRRSGTLVVAAYDETRTATPRFPQPASGVVYAVDGYRGVSGHVPNAISMPGHDVMTTLVGGHYGFVGGHSVAAAHLSAAAALLMQAHPGDTAAEIITALKDSTRQIGEQASVDLCVALQLLGGSLGCAAPLVTY